MGKLQYLESREDQLPGDADELGMTSVFERDLLQQRAQRILFPVPGADGSRGGDLLAKCENQAGKILFMDQVLGKGTVSDERDDVLGRCNSHE